MEIPAAHTREPPDAVAGCQRVPVTIDVTITTTASPMLAGAVRAYRVAAARTVDGVLVEAVAVTVAPP
ncbi:hypothetical protein GCM10009617_34280 [Leifsonia poae]